MRVHNIYIKQRLDEKLTAKEEFDLTEIYGNIIQSLHETAKKVLGEKYKRQSRKMWWTEEIEDFVGKKKELYQKWLHTKRYEDKQAYLEIKRKTRRIIIAEKNEMWDRKCQEINTYIGGRKCSEARKFIKKVRTSEKESVHLQMIPTDKWVQYYQNLLRENLLEYEGTKNIAPIQVDGGRVEVSKERVREAVRELKNGKSCGPGVYAEMLKHGTDKLITMLIWVINRCLSGEEVPQQCKVAYISSIHKKGSKEDCSNYRDISVTSVMSRLYGKILRDLNRRRE